MGTRVSHKVTPPRGPPHTSFQKMNRATLVLTHIFSHGDLVFYGNGSVLQLVFFFFCLLQVKNLGKFQQEENLQDPYQQFML